VVVGNIDHPGSNEGILAEEILLHPGPRLGEGFGDLACLPDLAMQQPSDLGLKIAVANDIRLAEKQRLLQGERVASVDQARDRVEEVVQVEKGLPGLQIAGIDVAGGIPLVDAHNLVGEKGVAAEAVIDAGRPDIDNRN
jgi:hypothetical protein